jgi:hypothetical protein
MVEYQEITGKEWMKSLVVIGVTVAIISISAFIVLPTYPLVWVGMVLAAAIVIMVIATREEKTAIYKCPACGQEFEVSATRRLLAPHGVTKKEGKWLEWKRLECPICHETSKMYPVKQE